MFRSRESRGNKRNEKKKKALLFWVLSNSGELALTRRNEKKKRGTLSCMLLCCFGFSEEGLRDKLVSIRSGFPCCLCGYWI
jgi:hypothetical protein